MSADIVERLRAAPAHVHRMATDTSLMADAATEITSLRTRLAEAGREPVRQNMKAWRSRANAAEAELAKARGALAQYAEQYCEGWCKDAPPHATAFRDCGGCVARAALHSSEDSKA